MGSTLTLLSRLRAERLPALMGIVNVTPDSFFDGGRHDAPGAAEARVEALLEAGADVLDVGGESTRPGSTPVPADEQRRRIEPAIRHAVALRALVSVDTASPEVARTALDWGAQIVNDVSCLADDELARVTARGGATLVLMHSRGSMSQQAGYSRAPESAYGDVVVDVMREWTAARDRAEAAGVPREHVWFDPGLGFAKSARHSFALLRRLREFAALGTPVVVGASRKSFIASIDPAPPEQRLGGTIATALHAAASGAALLRVHDVAEVRQALRVMRELGAEAAP